MPRLGLNEYELYVFDLDGTLYDQTRLRFIMASRLMAYYVLHPMRIKELLMLQDFRKTKDSWKGRSEESLICAEVAKKHKVDTGTVENIVKRWIYENPLSAVAKTKRTAVTEWIEELRKNNKTVVILSDYPTEDKLKALGVVSDAQYSTTDERIGELKPSPKGLEVILNDFAKQADAVLMIGDRDEKDGLCAQSAGVDYVNVKNLGR